MNRVLGGVIATLVLVVAAVAAPAAAASGAPLDFLLKWGTPGSGAGQFDRPLFVAVDDVGNVYVTDNGNHRVQKFDANGNHIGGWGSYGSADGQFNAPRGIAFFDGNEADPANYVYVVDSLNHRVREVRHDGRLHHQVGDDGSGDGEFMVPSGIAVGPSGAVYVGDCRTIASRSSAPPARSSASGAATAPATASSAAPRGSPWTRRSGSTSPTPATRAACRCSLPAARTSTRGRASGPGRIRRSPPPGWQSARTATCT